MKISSMFPDQWLPTQWRHKGGMDDPFKAIRKQMDEVFADWTNPFVSPISGRGPVGFNPRFDIKETDEGLVLTVDLPGVEKKDVDVTVAGDLLTVKGEKKTEFTEKKDEKGRIFHRVERSHGYFERTMTLPFVLDSTKVSAEFKDGVLKIVIPKTVEVQRHTHKIEIKSANRSEVKSDLKKIA